jgi:hypothetical protein
MDLNAVLNLGPQTRPALDSKESQEFTKFRSDDGLNAEKPLCSVDYVAWFGLVSGLVKVKNFK